MNIEETLNVTKEDIKKRINLYNSEYKGNYEFEETMFENFKRYGFFL